MIQRDRQPFVTACATDLSLGTRFEFAQDQFDQLGSDLSNYHVARAVTIPFFMRPISLKNYARPDSYRRKSTGRCLKIALAG